jgi:hypothetical protein
MSARITVTLTCDETIRARRNGEMVETRCARTQEVYALSIPEAKSIAQQQHGWMCDSYRDVCPFHDKVHST